MYVYVLYGFTGVLRASILFAIYIENLMYTTQGRRTRKPSGLRIVLSSLVVSPFLDSTTITEKAWEPSSHRYSIWRLHQSFFDSVTNDAYTTTATNNPKRDVSCPVMLQYIIVTARLVLFSTYTSTSKNHTTSIIDRTWFSFKRERQPFPVYFLSSAPKRKQRRLSNNKCPNFLGTKSRRQRCVLLRIFKSIRKLGQLNYVL